MKIESLEDLLLGEDHDLWFSKIKPKYRPAPESEKVGYLVHFQEKGVFLNQDQFNELKKWVNNAGK